MRIVSIGAKLEQLDGLRGTNDLSEWEAGFVEGALERLRSHGTTFLSEKQVEKIEQIWSKHFA